MIFPTSIIVLVAGTFLATTTNALSSVEQQQDFLADNTVILETDDYPIFSGPKEFKKHTPDLFKNIDALSFATLLEKFSGKTPQFDGAGQLTHFSDRRDWNEYEATEWVKSVEKKDLEGLSDEGCSLVWMIVGLMPEGKRNFIKPKCMLRSFTADEFAIEPEHYQFVTTKHLETIGGNILDALHTVDSAHVEVLNKFTLKQFEVLVKRKNCSKINAAAINSLDEEFLQKITPDCFAQMAELDTAGLEGERVKLLRNNIMTKVKASKQPTEEVYKALRKEQSAALTNCKGLYINKLGEEGAQGLKSSCLTSYLSAVKSNEDVKFGKKFWSNVSVTAFEAIPENMLRVLNRLDVDNHITAKITAALLKREAACKILKADAKLADPTNTVPFSVSLECFSSLKPKLQAFVLTTVPNLDAKILTSATSRQVKDWVFTDASGNEQSGIMILNHLRVTGSNLQEVLENMSSTVGAGPNHVCAAIESQDQLRDLTAANKYFDRACIQSLKFPLNPEAMKEMPHIFFNQPYEKIAASLDADFFKTVKKEDLEAMSSEGSLCAQLPKERFADIPTASLAGLSAKCLAKLPYQDALTAEQVAAMKADIFAGFKAVDFAKLNIKLLSPAQLASASSKVEDTKENIATLFTETFLATTTVDHFAKITRRQWAIVAPASYKAFNKEKFAAIPADAMVDMSLEQVKEVPLAVLKGITKEQAEKIGLNNKDPKTSAILAFKSILAEVGPEVRAVLVKRGLNGAAALIAVPATAMIAAVTAAILAF